MLDKAPATAERFFRSSSTQGRAVAQVRHQTFNRLGIALRPPGPLQDAVAEYGQALKITAATKTLLQHRRGLTEGGRHTEPLRALEG